MNPPGAGMDSVWRSRYQKALRRFGTATAWACAGGIKLEAMDRGMADLDVENYKKSVAKAVDRWSKKLDAIGKQLDPVTKELDQLSKLGSVPPSIADAVKKRQAELQKKADDLQKQMDKAALELRADIMLLPPPKAADPKETKKLPAWLEDIIKKGGVPLGDSVSVMPDVDFDLKTGQLKKCVVTFKVDLP